MYYMGAVEKCPVCEGSGESYLRDGEGTVINMDKCRTCGLIYQNPRMSKKSLDNYYRSGDYLKQFPYNPKAEVTRAERIVQLTERFKMNPKRILDVGCGRGILLKQLEIYNFAAVVGMDYGENSRNIENYVTHEEDVEGAFDLVTCIHTLEHTYDPLEMLRWMVSKTKPDGTILIEIPQGDKLHLPHTYIFNEQSFKVMMEKLGLVYLYINREAVADILIGNRYKHINIEKVVYSYDSPDFATEQEYAKWMVSAYGK